MLWIAGFLITGCQKLNLFLHEEDRDAANKKRVNVSGIEQLYSAVNDSANAGSRIVLAPGTYILDPNHPNAGRIELLKDMELTGQAGQSEKVIIDESLLPAVSFTIPSARTGGIRMGSGTNILEWLTVKGGTIIANAFSVIDTDLPSAETHIGIFHVNIIGNGSSVGIDIRNRRPEQAGRIIDATLEHNDISGVVTFLGPGIEIQNANSASGSTIRVNLRENYIHGNKVGVGAFNNAASVTVINSRIELTSHADRIEGNGIGMYLAGGVSQVAAALGNGNATVIEMHGSSIRNNNPVPMPPELQPVVASVIPCGIQAESGFSTTGGTASNNTLNASFWGCDISENHGTDINALGAYSISGSPAGANNVVEIHLDGVSKKAAVVATPSSPAEPAGTNIVSILR